MIGNSTGKRAVNSLLVRIDSRSREPLQQQVYAGIRRAILDGVLRPGTRLPSSRALAADLGVSRTTTVVAIEQLTAEGYLTARHGSGTFVARNLPDDLPPARVLPAPNARARSLSHRGAALTAVPSAGWRVGGPPRAFRVGVPALDLFPVRVWSRLVARRARSATLTQLDYNEVAGVRALREAIADHVTTARGMRCTADQVFIVAGAQRGIEEICRCLLDHGDRVLMEDPGFPGARSALVSAGAEIVPAPVDASGADVPSAAKSHGDARLAYVTPSHQFPVGVAMSLARRQALLEWAKAAGAWIVEDDYDNEFRYGARPLPCLHGLDPDGRVIYVGSFSKSLFPALRLGFLIMPPDLQQQLVAARRAADLHPPTLDQLVLADLMSEGHFERHLRRMRSAYCERRDALLSAADRFCRGALRVRPIHTGLHAVADLDEADGDAVFREAARRGIEVMPLSAYSVSPRPANALVMGFACARPDTLRAGMEQLAAAIEAAARPTTRFRSAARR
jgi:GntR family transcriptional regulator / MocR family aminotransferase